MSNLSSLDNKIAVITGAAGADVQGAEHDQANDNLIIASAPTVTAGLRQIISSGYTQSAARI